MYIQLLKNEKFKEVVKSICFMLILEKNNSLQLCIFYQIEKTNKTKIIIIVISSVFLKNSVLTVESINCNSLGSDAAILNSYFLKDQFYVKK